MVKGATSGIGLAAAAHLARHGRDVAIIARSNQSASAAVPLVRRLAAPGAKVSWHAADLAHSDQVRSLAGSLRSEYCRLEALVLCAAVVNPSQEVTDGVDTTLAVNHLAPALLCRELDDTLANGRIVLVTSSQHGSAGPFDPKLFESASRASGSRRYEATKLLNLLFTSARLCQPHAAPMETLDPGFVRTNLGRNTRGALRLMLTLTRPIQTTPAKPGRLIAHRLAADDFEDGAHVGFNGAAKRAANAVDEVAADRAWGWTNELLANWKNQERERP